MAKQTGSIRLKGTIGGINYYHSKNGGDLARSAGGGYTRESIKSKPSMVRTRENASEFGHCSSVKKHLRMALAPFLCVHKDGNLHVRLMRMLTELKKLDAVNDRGNRRVGQGLATPKGKELLENFDFTPGCKVHKILGASLDYNFGTRSLNVTNFDIKAVRFPDGASHMALTLGLLHFDFDLLNYQLKTSIPLYFDKAFVGDTFHMQVDEPTINGTAIAVLGMKFYDQVAQKFYLFKSAKAVGLFNCGIV